MRVTHFTRILHVCHMRVFVKLPLVGTVRTSKISFRGEAEVQLLPLKNTCFHTSTTNLSPDILCSVNFPPSP